MLARTTARLRGAFIRSERRLARLKQDDKGATAVEFAMVVGPFIFLLFGIIEVGLLFFTTFSVENATEQAARLIRTGQVKTNNMTAAQFKTQVCNRMPGYVDCINKVRVDVQSFASFATVAAPSGLDVNGNLNNATQFAPGNGGDIVLVTVFFEYELAAFTPMLNLSNMSSNHRLIQAAAIFRNEPFN